MWGCGASRQSESISISKNKAPPLWLNRVKWSPFIHSHCFYHHSQCLRTKIKFACGCGASRKAGSISISKNKAPPLWLNRVKWSPFIHSHCFYYHSQCLRTKIKFACGCGASRQVGSISISKNKAPLPLLLHMVKWSPYIHFYCFLLSQPKFACGCGASRKAGSISISKNKAPPLWLNRVKWSPFIYSHF